MCHYQDIHTASHHLLLAFNLIEQKSHVCDDGVLTRREDEGKKCPLHSCCLLRREIVFQCSEIREGKCENAYAEVVFVAPKTERTKSGGIWPWGKKARQDQGKEPEENRQKAVSDSGEAKTEAPVMEFWPEDQPEQIVRVYLE
ncbi:hypothetical protein Hte_009325 [Hypoxylon texense]